MRMDFQSVNMDAVEDTLTLIGGPQLLSMVTSVYEAINKAELRGQEDGFAEGHAVGVVDGRAQMEIEILGKSELAKENAQVEGFNYADAFPEVFKPGSDEQPSDEGLAGLGDGF